MTKTALLVIDMQNAYFNNDALEAHKEEIIAACNELITQAKVSDWPVYIIRTVHEKDTSTWTLNMLDDGVGYLYDGEEDADIVEGVITTGMTEILKTRDSAFYETELLDLLRASGIETVVLCGVSTHSCIMLTAADAYAANLRVVLASDAIRSHDPKYHDATLEMLRQEYRQQLLSNAEIIDLAS